MRRMIRTTIIISALIYLFASGSVIAYSNINTCNYEYAPVCGQQEFSCPPGAYCPLMAPTPRTYRNICELNSYGAKFLYWGVCANNNFQTNKSPVIHTFSGPTVLNVNQEGVWSINASDPENGVLTYNIDWGDNPMYAYSTSNYGEGYDFVQNTSFQHSYSRAGVYTVIITVRDSAGNTVRSSTTVRVDNVYQQPWQPQPLRWPYYWDYYGYNNYYYDWDWQWQYQDPYGWGGWNGWSWNY